SGCLGSLPSSAPDSTGGLGGAPGPWHGAHLLLYAKVGSVLFSPSLSAGPSATAQKPTLTLDPPWSTVFRGESVTLMCSTSHPPGRGFTWYHNDKSLRSTIKNSLRIEYTEMSDTGRYQCEAPGSGRSDPVLLTISNDWLILQAPYYAMFEGDPLRLRCYGWRGAKVSGISYYRDGANVEPSHVNSELFIKQAKTRDSGRYHCTGSMRTEVIVTKVSSPKVSISVQAHRTYSELSPGASSVSGARRDLARTVCARSCGAEDTVTIA
uniref:Ig-like domain-containing protein n=1 Tax=Terrapene triunguis TaxID=2587831 RepID=A0A674J0F5_9SAUR